MQRTNNSLITQKSSIAEVVDPWTPRIHEVSDDVLFLDGFDGNPTCTFGPWPPCGVAGQRVWLSIEHPDVAPLQVLTDKEITESEVKIGVSRELVRNWFETLPPDSDFRVVAKVALCGNHDEASALLLPVRTYRINTSKTTFREEFTVPMMIPFEPHHLGNGLSVKCATARVAWVTQVPNISDPTWGELCLRVGEAGPLTFEFREPASQVSFSYAGLTEDHRSHGYRYQETGGWLGEMMDLPATGGTENPPKDLVIKSERGIVALEIQVGAGPDEKQWYIDNVTWTVK